MHRRRTAKDPWLGELNVRFCKRGAGFLQQKLVGRLRCQLIRRQDIVLVDAFKDAQRLALLRVVELRGPHQEGDPAKLQRSGAQRLLLHDPSREIN